MRPRNRNRVVTEFSLPSMTKQAPAQEVDINHIVNRYLKTGQLPPAQGEPVFGYVPSIDLQEAFELVANASEHFDGLPSQVRQHFSNSPLELLRAVEDPSQRDMLAELGLLKSNEIVAPAASGDVSSKVAKEVSDSPTPES